MPTKNVTDDNFDTEVIKSTKPILVDFWAEWCGPCKQIGPVLDEISSEMSDRIIIKVPCSVESLGVFHELDRQGVDTYCTTVFSLPQAAAVAQAGAKHILPFCEPVREVGGDPTKLVRECVDMFNGWENRPYITAALVRSVETAHLALNDGADGIIIFWNVYQEMLSHSLTDEWNQMGKGGMLKGSV